MTRFRRATVDDAAALVLVRVRACNPFANPLPEENIIMQEALEDLTAIAFVGEVEKRIFAYSRLTHRPGNENVRLHDLYVFHSWAPFNIRHHFGAHVVELGMVAAAACGAKRMTWTPATGSRCFYVRTMTPFGLEKEHDGTMSCSLEALRPLLPRVTPFVREAALV